MKLSDSRSKEVSLSDQDIERLAEQIMQNKLFEKQMSKEWERIQDYLELMIAKRIGWAIEDQAKFRAINDILSANYREKLKKMEEE